jgi:HD-GYP domain-containing protein (c-di-GMP phosphodiesterase class II)
MESHPGVGQMMLRHLDWDDEVLKIVRNHHERWDGGGYPDRLSGEEIPEYARLVAICDTLDAMTSDRPYRRGFSFAEAAAEIDRVAGSQFDPRFVAAFREARDALEVLRENFRREDEAGFEPAEALAIAVSG